MNERAIIGGQVVPLNEAEKHAMQCPEPHAQKPVRGMRLKQRVNAGELKPQEALDMLRAAQKANDDVRATRTERWLKERGAK